MKPNTARLGMLIAATVAVGAFAVATPASAAVVTHSSPAVTGAPDAPYPIAYNERTIPLTGDPNENMPGVCVSTGFPGTIELTAGDYEWDMFIGTKYPHTRDVDIWLESATYTWADCLVPQNGYYWQYSVLCPLDGVHPCAELDAYPWITSGTYTFGSWLDWLHP